MLNFNFSLYINNNFPCKVLNWKLPEQLVILILTLITLDTFVCHAQDNDRPKVAVGVAGMYTDVMDNTDEMGMAFTTVTVPISDWWGGAHKLKISKAKIESAGYQLNETSELLTLQITQAANELDETYFQTGIAQKSLEQAEENLRVTQSNYKAGVAGMSDLLEAQAACQDARNNLSDAQCNYLIKKAKYLQTINNYK